MHVLPDSITYNYMDVYTSINERLRPLRCRKVAVPVDLAWGDPVKIRFIVALPRQAASLPSPVCLELHTDMVGHTCADLIRASLATLSKKVAQKLAGFLATHAFIDNDTMIVQWRNKGIEYAAGSTRLRISRSENDSRHARMNDGASAHHARFQGHVQGCVRKAVIAQLSACVAQGFDFGVCARIIGTDTAIETLADDFAVVCQHRANGNFFMQITRMTGQFERPLHHADINRIRRRLVYSHSIVAGGLPLIS